MSLTTSPAPGFTLLLSTSALAAIVYGQPLICDLPLSPQDLRAKSTGWRVASRR